MRKTIAIALASAACALGTTAAHAGGNVYWSIGISAPPVATVISNGPVYAPAPVYVAPAPVYYEPAPVYYEPAPVFYAPPPVVYAPRVVYRPVPAVAYRTGYYYTPGWRHHGHHDEYGQVYGEGHWAERRRHHDER